MYKKPILAFFAMILIQVMTSFAILIPAVIYNGMMMSLEGEEVKPETLIAVLNGNSSVLSIALIVSSLVTIIFMKYPLKMFSFRDNFAMPKLSFDKYVILLPLAFLGIFATDVFSEILDLPNLIEAEMGDMTKTTIGVLTIAIIAPLAEEVCFRGAIQQYLHKNGATPMRAIFVSSVLFAVMHMNPAQIPFAFVVGLILGVFYWKTGSLILPCVIHMVNNGAACYLSNLDSEISFVELLGGTMPAVIYATFFLALCGYSLYKWAKE